MDGQLCQRKRIEGMPNQNGSYRAKGMWSPDSV